MEQTKTYFGYVAINKDKEGGMDAFAYGRDHETVMDTIAHIIKSTNDHPDEKAKHKDGDDPHILQSTLNRVVDTIGFQNEVLSMYAGMGGALVDVFKEELHEYFVKNGDLIEEGDTRVVFGLDDAAFSPIGKKLQHLRRTERTVKALPPALLLSLVATFDSTMSDIVRDMLAIKPETLQASSKSVTLSDILTSNSIEEIKEKVIRDEVYLFSRGSHDEQVSFIEKNFHIEIRSHWKRWPDFIEVFERRNLIAHGEKSFTTRYASICTAAGHKIAEKQLGSEIGINYDYLKKSSDILFEFSLLLVFSLWRKHFSESMDEACASINDICYKLILNQKYRVPIRVLEHVLSLKGANISDAHRKMMIINLASAHIHAGDAQKCDDVLNGVDWSASSDKFKICVEALRKNTDAVLKLLPAVAATDSISTENFRIWPAFDYIREDAEVCAKFFEVYGEAISPDKTTEAVDFSGNVPQLSAPQSDTKAAR